MKKVKICITMLLIAVFFGGCDLLRTEEPTPVKDIEVSITGLTPIADTSLQYVGWIVKASGTTAKALIITPDANGVFSVRQDFQDGLMQQGISFLVTIEKKSSDTAKAKPSGTQVLSGLFKGPNAELQAVMLDYSKLSGKYTLVTPTDLVGINDNNGIWFVDSVTYPGGPVAGLKLGAIGSTWVYQGWIEKDGKLITTGEFRGNTGKDSTNKYSDVGAGYNFPGEDFLLNAPAGFSFPLDLKGAKVFITLQPVMGDRTIPWLKVMESTIPQDAAGKVSYELTVPSADKRPKGNVKFYLQM